MRALSSARRFRLFNMCNGTACNTEETVRVSSTRVTDQHSQPAGLRRKLDDDCRRERCTLEWVPPPGRLTVGMPIGGSTDEFVYIGSGSGGCAANTRSAAGNLLYIYRNALTVGGESAFVGNEDGCIDDGRGADAIEGGDGRRSGGCGCVGWRPSS